MLKLALPTAILLSIFISACAPISPQERHLQADKMAAERNWRKLPLVAGNFILTAYVPVVVSPSTVLTVYIEGDGLSWESRTRVSDDPTPVQTVALELALQHAHGPAVYLARPCQYVQASDARACSPFYWTQGRFSPEVISATHLALDALKQRYAAQSLVLVGYSGGGAVAALAAAARADVISLVTVAGTLDHQAWTALHRVTPLLGSLNPADAWNKLKEINQKHYVGGKDRVVPLAVTQSYVSRFPTSQRPPIEVIADFDHQCCWVQSWPKLSAPGFEPPNQ